MHNTLTITYNSVEKIRLKKDYHYHIHIPTFYEFDKNLNDRVDFIIDTGAYITVLTRKEASLFGFLDSKYTIQADVPLSGVTGDCLSDIKSIPGLIIGGRRLEGVKVAVPHVDTETNILGLNVLELFNYYLDADNDLIYFANNLNPDIPEDLRSNKVYILNIKSNDEPNIDPFYSEKNMNVLRESIRDADAGKLTEHELIEE